MPKTWQTNTETNFGIDLGFSNNRLTLGIDYYTSDIQDILINQAQSEVLGNPSSVLNVGDVTSSGIEFELGALLVNNDDFLFIRKALPNSLLFFEAFIFPPSNLAINCNP